MALDLRRYGDLENSNSCNGSVDDGETSSNRAGVIARYRQLREISKRHHHEILALVSTDALLKQARRLGLTRGKTLLLDDIEELNYAYDLAIHTASPQRSRAIDRYAKSAGLTAGSDEAVVLEAMRAARFSILAVKQRHKIAGLIATDLLRQTEVWLVDIGLENSLDEGNTIATRLYTPERFSMTAGVNVPFDPELLLDITAELPRSLGDSPLYQVADNRQFAEAIYRSALASGIMDRVKYQDLPDDS